MLLEAPNGAVIDAAEGAEAALLANGFKRVEPEKPEPEKPKAATRRRASKTKEQ